MSLLDRFSNPLWYKASKLDINRQRVVAMVIGSYGFCRQCVESELVSRVESFLETSGISGMAETPLTSKIKGELADEALVGLFRCGRCPDSDPTGKVPAQILHSVPKLLGMFALADINHRLNRSTPNVLDQTEYSKDPDEARTQVLTKWMGILGISTPHFVTRANSSGFAEAWDELAISMFGGTLKGFLRTTDNALFAKARRVAADIPPHRVRLIEYFIEKLAKTPFGRNARGEREGTVDVRPAAVAPARTTMSQSTTNDGVEFLPDGRAVLHGSPNANFGVLIQQLTRIFRRNLKPNEMIIAARWAARVTGRPIRQGVWEREHEEAFVSGFERFIWEGNVPSEELREQFANIKMWLRETYPVLIGSSIDVDLDEPMRGLYREMLGASDNPATGSHR